MFPVSPRYGSRSGDVVREILGDNFPGIVICDFYGGYNWLDKALKDVERRLDRLTRMKVTRGKATTLVKRIAKYRDDLIRFVTHPGVEFHNNRAERQLRPLVISRKVSFGSNTEHGARRYCVLHSVRETRKIHGVDPIDFLRRSYLSGGLDVPDLVGTGPPSGTEDSA